MDDMGNILLKDFTLDIPQTHHIINLYEGEGQIHRVEKLRSD